MHVYGINSYITMTNIQIKLSFCAYVDVVIWPLQASVSWEWYKQVLTPARYNCRGICVWGASSFTSTVAATSIVCPAATNKTSPFFTPITFWVSPWVMTPIPSKTSMMEGPIVSTSVDLPTGTRMWSTSNSSKGGVYLLVKALTGVPVNTSGKPCGYSQHHKTKMRSFDQH